MRSFNAAVYIRVSTQEQAEHGFSIGVQKERLLAYCKAMGWTVYDVYIDAGWSGGDLARPAMQKLTEDIKKVDIVVVYKLDRLSRSQFDILDLIQNTFLPNDVHFVSMTEMLDTSTQFGRLMLGILAAFAQLEREQIKERTEMGRKGRAKEGKWHGGAFAPVGYDYVKGELIINEYEAEQIRLMYEMAADGKSNREIVDELNARGFTTKYGNYNQSYVGKISRILRKEVYLGTVSYKDVITKNAHEPIVDEELFLAANNARKMRRETYGNIGYKRTSLLAGFLRCSKCGARFTTTISKYKAAGSSEVTSTKYYTCYSRAYPKSKMAKREGCENKIWRSDMIEEKVGATIKKLALDKNFFKEILKLSDKPNDKYAPLKHRLREINKQISKLMELYSLDKIPIEVLSGKIDELHKEKEALTKKLAEKEKETPPLPQKNVKEIETVLKNVAHLWDAADKEQKRYLLSLLVNGIYIDDDELIFDWAFTPQGKKR